MATAEVLKFTKSIDDKAKVLIDGTQTNQPSPQSFPNSLCDLATAMLQQSTDETKEAIQQMASEAALALARTGIHDIMILRTNQCRPLPNLNPFFFFSHGSHISMCPLPQVIARIPPSVPLLGAFLF